MLDPRIQVHETSEELPSVCMQSQRLCGILSDFVNVTIVNVHYIEPIKVGVILLEFIVFGPEGFVDGFGNVLV